jgi:glycerol-3-phosphate dehydrogenase
MWNSSWREREWEKLSCQWDLIIIGGGITGAGILREATRAGLKPLLLESRDFASGTSSRSSKLVHGGFRYLRNAQMKLTLQSVQERQRLLHAGKGLVNPLEFLLACHKGDRTPPYLLSCGLALYDLLSFKWSHRTYKTSALQTRCTLLTNPNLVGGFVYGDALTDDARLVLRVLQEAVSHGGSALNYAAVEGLMLSRSGHVKGVVVRDQAPTHRGRIADVYAPVIINSTGAWADELRAKTGSRPRLRKLRGSHLVFPGRKLPIDCAISFFHPADQRPVFVFPWDSVTIIGTTDVDHTEPSLEEPAISQGEVDYLMAAINFAFPDCSITLADIRATFSGVRGVVDTGKTQPWKESREHVLWDEKGMLTITGGKLTTFRRMALDALKATRYRWSGKVGLDPRQPILDEPTGEPVRSNQLDELALTRLFGRFGKKANHLLSTASSAEFDSIDGTSTLWAELRWAARNEGVIHLDDLLLRRVPLGILLPDGGLEHFKRIQQMAQSELDWDAERWDREAQRYTAILQAGYRLPEMV